MRRPAKRTLGRIDFPTRKTSFPRRRECRQPTTKHPYPRIKRIQTQSFSQTDVWKTALIDLITYSTTFCYPIYLYSKQTPDLCTFLPSNRLLWFHDPRCKLWRIPHITLQYQIPSKSYRRRFFLYFLIGRTIRTINMNPIIPTCGILPPSSEDKVTLSLEEKSPSPLLLTALTS